MAASKLFEHPLAEEILAYQRMRRQLERDHYGRWVIIHASEKTGKDYGSYNEAAGAAQELGLDVLACFIRQVGVEAAIFLSHGN